MTVGNKLSARDKRWLEIREEKWRAYEECGHPFPVDVVGIETVGSCNRACGYCPVSVHPKRQGRLSTEVVEAFFDQLADLGFEKKIVFHFYNEPMLEKRLNHFVKYAAEKMPRAIKWLSTNGDLLDKESLIRLIDDGASAIKVSSHDAETFERFQELHQALESEYAEKLLIRDFYKVGDGTKARKITNRGGSIDLSAYGDDVTLEAAKTGCGRVEFYVDYLGNVHPCCMDFNGGYILGNILESTIIDIWNVSKNQYREHFFGSYTKDVCLKCAGLSSAKAEGAAALATVLGEG